MVLKRRPREEGDEERSEHLRRRRNFVSTILCGRNYARSFQEFVPVLEPLIRKWVQEEVSRAIEPFFSISCRPHSNQAECSGTRNLQLQFGSNLPHTLFTGNRLVAKDGNPMKLVLYDSCSGKTVTGPLPSVKATIVVLEGDFGPDDRQDWTEREFDSKTVQNREGRRPLLTGELIVPLQDGVGYVGELRFTDNSSWMRSGKFRLGAKLHANSDGINVREGISNAFKVKDQRGESYQKHYPPFLDDEVWRLEKIAKGGRSHDRLHQYGISSVREFLRLYATDQFRLREILHNMSNKAWLALIQHATTCTLDDKKYIYTTAQGTGLLFNSIYNVVGVTFDGQSYLSVGNLDVDQMRVVEDLKQQAYRSLKDWVPFCNPSTVGFPIHLPSPADGSFDIHNSHPHGSTFQEQDQRKMVINIDHPTISLPYDTEFGLHNSSFEIGESSQQMQGFNPTFRTSFGLSNFAFGHYIGGNYEGSPPLSTDDLPAGDNFQVQPTTWQGNGVFLGSSNHNNGIISSSPGSPAIFIPSSRRPKTKWCKVLAVVKWRILVRRNVAARKWKHSCNYYM